MRKANLILPSRSSFCSKECCQTLCRLPYAALLIFYLWGCIRIVISKHFLWPEITDSLEIGHRSRTSGTPQLIPSIAGSAPFPQMGVNSPALPLSQQPWDNLPFFGTRLWGHWGHGALYKPGGDGQRDCQPDWSLLGCVDDLWHGKRP